MCKMMTMWPCGLGGRGRAQGSEDAGPAANGTEGCSKANGNGNGRSAGKRKLEQPSVEAGPPAKQPNRGELGAEVAAPSNELRRLKRMESGCDSDQLRPDPAAEGAALLFFCHTGD